jgi:hypothetical protein
MCARRGRREDRHVTRRAVNRCAEKNTLNGAHVDQSSRSSVRPSIDNISVWAVAAIPRITNASTVVPNFHKSFPVCTGLCPGEDKNGRTVPNDPAPARGSGPSDLVHIERKLNAVRGTDASRIRQEF